MISPETSVELSEFSVDFSERNTSVVKTRNFELHTVYPKDSEFQNSLDEVLQVGLKYSGSQNLRILAFDEEAVGVTQFLSQSTT
jgi:hypothetical protein